jgi:PKD repeat protein
LDIFLRNLIFVTQNKFESMEKQNYFLVLLLLLAISACNKEPEACLDYQKIDLVVNFDGTCSLNAATYRWDFGDGSGSLIANPQHAYAGYGSYDVTLTVETKRGKTASITNTVTMGPPANALIDGIYALSETCTTGTQTYSVVISPDLDNDNHSTFNGLWFGGSPVTAVIDASGHSFTIARQTIKTGKEIVSTTGTINTDGTRIDLNYQIVQTSNGALVDQCVAVLQR